jgi:hypothetical protein
MDGEVVEEVRRDREKTNTPPSSSTYNYFII